MNTHVYVVMGETGEYSDRFEWPVLAYLIEAEAQAHVLRAEAWLREQRIHETNATISIDYDKRNVLAYQNPHDPQMMGPSYTGNRYYLMTVPLSIDALDVEAAARSQREGR